MSNKPLLLVLEEDQAQQKYYEKLMIGIGFDVKAYAYYKDALDALNSYSFNAFLVDLRILVRDPANKGAGGDTFIKNALLKHPGTPLAVISAHFDHDCGTRLTTLFMEATSCLYAHIEKPGEHQLMDWANKAYQFYLLKFDHTKSAPHNSYHVEDSRIRKIINEVIPLVSSVGLPVFILGETGTGKEDMARFIHNQQDNPFRKGPFVAINCAAVNDELLLSELFGHVCGAYTGANNHRLGLFLEASGWNHRNTSTPKTTISYHQWVSSNNKSIKYAKKIKDNPDDISVTLMNNQYYITDESNAEYIFSNSSPGTLFLDEIGDLSPSAEAALLRALDGYGIRPLGYTGPSLLPHCCIIAATNRIKSKSDLRDDTALHDRKKGIRRELFHRLAGWVFELPPLRERRATDHEMEWILSLKKWAASDNLHFKNNDLEYFADCLSKREGKLWDGNWRELKYFYARAMARAKLRLGNHQITKEDLEFASKWVLIDDYTSSSSSLMPDYLKYKYRDVEVRLDYILSINYIFQICINQPGHSIDNVISGSNFTSLNLCEKVSTSLLANKNLLIAAVQISLNKEKVTNTAIDTLMGNSGALKVWWRGNAEATADYVNLNITKYGPILNIIENLSPINFHVVDGVLKANI